MKKLSISPRDEYELKKSRESSPKNISPPENKKSVSPTLKPDAKTLDDDIFDRNMSSTD